MPRTLTDIFNEFPSVKVIEVIGHQDCRILGLSSDGQKLGIFDDEFARQLAELPDARTAYGHITTEGYHICAYYYIIHDSHKAVVYRHDKNNQ